MTVTNRCLNELLQIYFAVIIRICYNNVIAQYSDALVSPPLNLDVSLTEVHLRNLLLFQWQIF